MDPNNNEEAIEAEDSKLPETSNETNIKPFWSFVLYFWLGVSCISIGHITSLFIFLLANPDYKSPFLSHLAEFLFNLALTQWYYAIPIFILGLIAWAFIRKINFLGFLVGVVASATIIVILAPITCFALIFGLK